MLAWNHAWHLSLSADEPQVSADTLPPLSSDFEPQSRGPLSADWSWAVARLHFKASRWTWGDSKNVKCSQTTQGMTARPYDGRSETILVYLVPGAAWGGLAPEHVEGAQELSALNYLIKIKKILQSLISWSLPASPLSIITCLFLVFFSFLNPHFCFFLYGDDDTSSAHLPQLPIRLTPAATGLLTRSARPL